MGRGGCQRKEGVVKKVGLPACQLPLHQETEELRHALASPKTSARKHSFIPEGFFVTQLCRALGLRISFLSN